MVREITVGIVDNDRFVLPSLKTSIEELSDDMQVIWTTSDGGQAVTNCLTAATRPKVLLADMSMEGVSGISVCRRIRTRIGKVGILAMTAYSIDKYAEKASLAGAQGIVGKSDDQQIVTAIRTIASGGTWGDGFEIALTAHVRLKNQISVNAVLTDREFEVMDSFAAGMSIQAIAETLNITPETVKKHGQRAMHKLGANSRWQAVAMAYMLGTLVYDTSMRLGLVAAVPVLVGIYVQAWRFPDTSWNLALNSAPVLTFLLLLILNFGQVSRNRSKLMEAQLQTERAQELVHRVEVARMIHDSVTGDLSNIARVSQRQLRRCGDPEQAEAWRQINEQSRRVLDGVHAVIRQLSTTDDDANASGGGDDGLSETLHERVAAWSRRLSEAGIRGDAVYTVAITLGERHAEIVGMNELPDGERDNGDIDAILDLPGGNGLRLRREEIEGLGGTMSVGQEDDSWVLYARVPYADLEQGESRARRRFR